MSKYIIGITAVLLVMTFMAGYQIGWQKALRHYDVLQSVAREESLDTITTVQAALDASFNQQVIKSSDPQNSGADVEATIEGSSGQTANTGTGLTLSIQKSQANGLVTVLVQPNGLLQVSKTESGKSTFDWSQQLTPEQQTQLSNRVAEQIAADTNLGASSEPINGALFMTLVQVVMNNQAHKVYCETENCSQQINLIIDEVEAIINREL